VERLLAWSIAQEVRAAAIFGPHMAWREERKVTA
jgi:hypothetical protein